MGASNAASNAQTSILQGLSPELQQLIQSFISGTEPGLASSQKQYAQQADTTATSLANFKGLQPQEVSELTQQAGNAVRSAANTFAAQTGGVANPALLEKQLAGTAGQTAGDVATNLGSIASQQKLQGLESAGNIFSGLSEQSLGAIMQSLGIGTQGAIDTASQYGNIQQNANQAKGQTWQGVGSLLGGAGQAAAAAGAGGAGAGAGAADEYVDPNPYLVPQAQYGQPGYQLPSVAPYTPPAPQYPGS